MRLVTLRAITSGRWRIFSPAASFILLLVVWRYAIVTVVAMLPS
jgi:hypothetical protein